MMDRTDRHFRVFSRGISTHALLYTEMVTTSAILGGDRERLLAHEPCEHPLALQLGGDDPPALSECAAIAEGFGYDEVNLNVGCPSERVRDGCFGAVLMRHPGRVAECVAAMRDRVRIPVTVKHRIGVDELDRYEDMLAFVDQVAIAGPDRFIVHARKAWLRGLSPKQNRTLPPLRHEDVWRLKGERPGLCVETNGGIRSADEIATHLEKVDGVMLGRAAWDDPMCLSEVDRRFFGAPTPPPRRSEVNDRYLPHVVRELGLGRKASVLLRGAANLFAGVPGSKVWKRSLAGVRDPDSAVALLALARSLEDAVVTKLVDPRVVAGAGAASHRPY
jgi:tRNA-dihydrouridine synthase A